MPNPVTDLLARHGLTRPDGRPLCTYLVTDAELDDLVASLHSVPSPQAFVLAGAELWRRHYAGGAWEWSVITTPLRLSFAPRDLTALTERGLRFWGRDILRLHRDEYLASIAREAGIPSPVLQSEGKRIRRFFKRLLEDLALYGTTRAKVLADLAATSLPERLRNPTFRDLAVECALSARDLAALKVPLADIPDWRSRFPLRLDDQAAQDLVNNLVDTAREAPPQRPLKVVTHLLDAGTAPKLRRILRLPAAISPDALCDFASLTPHQLAPRIDLLTIPMGHRPPSLLAHLIRRGDAYVVEILTDRLPPDHEITLALRAQGQVLATFRPPGATLSELPWVFAPDPGDDSLHRLVAQGSARFPAGSHLLVAASDGCTIAPPISTQSKLGDRTLYRIDDDTRLIGPDYELRLRVGTPSPDDTYTWQGETLPFDDSLYLGAPGLIVQREDGTTRVIPARSLDIAQPALGRTRIRYLAHGEILYEDRLDLLPKDLKLQVKPLADSPGAPRQRVSLSVTSADQPLLGTTLTVLERTDTSLVIAPTGDRPPATIELHLTWPRHGAHVDLRLPYPRTTVTLIDLDSDSPVAPGVSLSLDTLHRYRAEGFSSRKHPVFQVEARLDSRDIQTSYIPLAHLSPQRGDVHSLPLYAIGRRIERLLSLTMTVDAKVNIQFVDEAGRTPPNTRFAVAHFGAELDIDRRAKVVRLAEPDVELVALDLQAPTTLHPLASDAQGTWSLRSLDDTTTSWMVFARRGSAVIAAPKLYASQASEQVDAAPLDNPEPSPLQQAIGLVRFEDRRAAIEHRLRELATLPGDSEWGHLEAFLSHDFPISTFESIRALIRVPAALCTLLLRSPHPQILVERFEDLPFIWCCLPFASILTALDAHHTHHRSLIAQHPNFANLLAEDHKRKTRAFVDALTQHAPGFGVIFAAIELRHPGILPRGVIDIARDTHFALTQPALAAGHLSNLQTQVVDDLRRRHADSHWPHHDALDSLAKRLPAPTTELRDLPEYQRPVVNAPLLAAQCAAAGVLPEPLEAYALRLCQGFDPTFFDEAYRLALPLAISQLTWGAP